VVVQDSYLVLYLYGRQHKVLVITIAR
jgi:hypothetical protein